MGGRGSSSGAKILDKSGKGGIIGSDNKRMAVDDVHYIGDIDIKLFGGIAEKRILTNEVIITDNRIDHIVERRGQDFYDKYHNSFGAILSDPDYIFRDNSPNTAIVSKRFVEHGKSVNIVLRLAVEGDDPSYKNSILTAIGENDKRFNQRLRNNVPVYAKKNIDKPE